MKLDPGIYETLRSIEWFASCGSLSVPRLGVETVPATSLQEALSGVESDDWQDARTHAQGELTGYLAKNHYDLYDSWNDLARESRQFMQSGIMPAVDDALQQLGAAKISESVLLDLNRIALHAAYRKRCRRVPTFFEALLAVYANGQLPCGWQGAKSKWPVGRLLVY